MPRSDLKNIGQNKKRPKIFVKKICVCLGQTSGICLGRQISSILARTKSDPKYLLKRFAYASVRSQEYASVRSQEYASVRSQECASYRGRVFDLETDKEIDDRQFALIPAAVSFGFQ